MSPEWMWERTSRRRSCFGILTGWFWPAAPELPVISKCPAGTPKVSFLRWISWHQPQKAFWIPIWKTTGTFPPKAGKLWLSAAGIREMTVWVRPSVMEQFLWYSLKWCQRRQSRGRKIIPGPSGRKSVRQITVRKKPLLCSARIPVFIRPQWKNF